MGRWGVIRTRILDLAWIFHHNNSLFWPRKLNNIKIAFISLAFWAAKIHQDRAMKTKSAITCSLTQGPVLRGGWLILPPVFAVFVSLASLLAHLSWKRTILINRTPWWYISSKMKMRFSTTPLSKDLTNLWNDPQEMHATFSIVTLWKMDYITHEPRKVAIEGGRESISS